MPAPSRTLLPTLLLVSGFCGISYEILYAKLLGNLLGNRFMISASVLLTFLLGIGLGTLYAHRFARRLWAIEAGIGLYAALLVLGQGSIEHLLYTQVSALGTSVLACALASIALLVFPAFLVGCSVPLFAAYLGTLRSTHVFSLTYGIYNLGAALTALTMEFAILRVMGLRAATLGLAALNILVAAGLLILFRTAAELPAPQAERVRFAPRVLAALALASVASAVFQLLMIKVAEFVFGPYHETFSLVLATVLLGLALGSLAAGRIGLSFRGALLVALSGLAWLLAVLPTAIEAYAAAYPHAVRHYVLLVGLKLAMILVVMGIPAIGFGATIPALLRVHRDVARESGQLLFVSSMGNVLGFLLMAFVLHRFFDYGPLLLVIATCCAAALWIEAGARRLASVAAALLLASAFAASAGLWNESLLYLGHLEFHSSRRLERALGQTFRSERFKGARDVFAIIRRDEVPYFFINGYISIPLANASEKIVAAISTLCAPRTDQALVLGVGSGATAGTVGLLFDHTDAVEINSVILDNQDRMREYNFDIEHNPRVTLIHDDGIHFIKTTQKKYSLILNTVTTPLYFSSSKLYTTDFLESVLGRLTPDGVYTTWIDRKIGDRGIDIILRTLDQTFDSCWLTYLKSSYYMMVCSNDELRARQMERISATPRLRAFLAEGFELPIELIPYGVLSVDAKSLIADADAPLNTLDFPALEHEMARLDAEARLLGFKDRLIRDLDLGQVRRVLGRDLPWDAGEFALWGNLRVPDSTTLGQVLHATVPAAFGDIDEPLKAAALRNAERLGTANGYARFGALMASRGICSTAVELVTKALELDPAQYRARYYLGHCAEKAGDETLAAEQYRRSLEIRPDYEKARQALSRLEHGRGGDRSQPIDPREEPDVEDRD